MTNLPPTEARCANCKHFLTDARVPPFGSCDRWRRGYSVAVSELALNEVLVENDEGWGMVVGPEFGCVLHKPAG